MSLVMAASALVFSVALAGLLVARRRLARALEAERLEALVASELAGFDRRCASKEGSTAEARRSEAAETAKVRQGAKAEKAEKAETARRAEAGSGPWAERG